MSTAMNDAQTSHILSRLEIGLRTDSSRLIELEQDLILTLRRARGRGEEFGSPGDWNTAWCHHWDHVEAILQRIRGLVNEMEKAITSNEASRLTAAMETWAKLQAQDAELVQALAELRQQAMGLNVTAQVEWKAMASALEPHLEMIHGCAQALRLKLELLKVHSKDEVDHLINNLLSKLPLRLQENAIDSGAIAQAYAQAETELDQEHHTYLGLMDVIKGLFLWVETTEERVDKNLSSNASVVKTRGNE
ncbi:MAG: hypothetical protein ABL974_22065 [Prosthecobacter sp.]